jgi:hypothetical protein
MGGVSALSAVRTEATGFTVTITGTNLSATVSPGGSFTLNGVPSGDIDLHITGSSVDTHLSIMAVSSGEMIHITITVSGSQANMTITDREETDHTIEVEGIIGLMNLNARTIVVDSRTISVPVTATIRHGNTALTLSDLKMGDRVHVKGMLSGGVIVATSVNLQNPGDD